MKRLIFLALIAALIVGAAVYIYKGKESKEPIFYGNVDTRTVNLGFPFLGKIESINKDEGERIEKDEILASLDSRNLKNRIEETKARLEGERAQLKKFQNGFRAEEIEEARGVLAEAKANAALLEDIFQRQEKLFQRQATSSEAYLTSKYKLDAAKGALEQANALYNLKTQGYQKEDIKAQNALVNSLEAALKAAYQDLEDSVIKSPVEGVILARLKEVGSIASPGERVLEVSKQDEFWVKAYVDEPYLGAISQGDKVLLHTDVADYDGVIGYISPTAEFTPKNIETAELRSDLVYSFRVLVKNPDKKIKQGMPVTIKLKK